MLHLFFDEQNIDMHENFKALNLAHFGSHVWEDQSFLANILEVWQGKAGHGLGVEGRQIRDAALKELGQEGRRPRVQRELYALLSQAFFGPRVIGDLFARRLGKYAPGLEVDLANFG
eukprot:11268147-Karenia_brevis.AAC.1